MKIIFRTIFRRLFKTFLAIASVFGVLFLILFVRLAMGPIEIKPLTEFVLQSFQDKDSDIKIEFKTAFLELGLQRGHLLDIKLTDLSVLRADDSVLANIPRANVSYSFLKLLKGQMIPSDVFIYQPYLDMNIDKSQIADAPATPIADEKRISDLLRRIRKLNHFYIEDGDLSLHLKNPDASVLVDKLNLDFQDAGDKKYELKISGEYYQGDFFMPVDLKGLYDSATRRLSFVLDYSDFDLTDLKKYFPLDGIDLDLKVNGAFTGVLDMTKEVGLPWVEKLSFDIENAAEGQVVLTELQATYPIKKITAKGEFAPALSSLSISPITIDIHGQVGQATVAFDGLGDFLLSGDFNRLQMGIDASIKGVPIEKVPMLWPATAGPDAHQWVRENVQKGTVDNLDFTMRMKGEDILDLKTVIDASGAEVVYWPTMPKIEKAKAQVILLMGRVEIAVLGGTCAGVDIVDGTVEFTDINEDFPLGHVQLSFAGPASSVVSVLSTEPIALNTVDGIDWKKVKGSVKGQATLSFPCEEKDEVHAFSAGYKGTVDDVVLPLTGVDFVVNEGSVSFDGTLDDIQIEGRGLLNGSAVRAKIYENWSDAPKQKPFYHIWADLSPSFFVPYFPDIHAYLKGEARTKADLFFAGDEMKIEALANLTKAEYTLPIGYTKPLDDPSDLKLSLVFKGGKWQSVPSFELSAEKDKVQISGHVDGGEKLQVKLNKIQAPRNDAQMSLSVKDTAFALDISGKKMDLEQVLHGRFLTSLSALSEKSDVPKKQSFDISATLDELYLARGEKPLTSVSVQVQKKDDRWTKFDGMAFADSPLSLALSDNKKELTASCQNLGSFLQRAGFTSRIDGGHLKATLYQEKDGTLQGEIRVKEFDLTQTPFFVQAATILGIVNAFSGDKIAFQKAVVPFKLLPNNDIEIQDGLASGRSVGVTFQGTLSDNGVDFKGNIIPAYAVNSLIGKVPLIGNMITGEEGGGLVGLSYTAKGPSDNVEVEYHPASLLAPGFLKNLFN